MLQEATYSTTCFTYTFSPSEQKTDTLFFQSGRPGAVSANQYLRSHSALLFSSDGVD